MKTLVLSFKNLTLSKRISDWGKKFQKYLVKATEVVMASFIIVP
jgi:hypothetical protein